jgi:hypothetical protein
MYRKSLPIVLVVLTVLALVASSAAFAADEPAVPLSQEEFMSTLQVQPDADAGEEMPELEGLQTPILKHGSFCSYQGQGARGARYPAAPPATVRAKSNGAPTTVSGTTISSTAATAPPPALSDAGHRTRNRPGERASSWP